VTVSETCGDSGCGDYSHTAAQSHCISLMRWMVTCDSVHTDRRVADETSHWAWIISAAVSAAHRPATAAVKTTAVSSEQICRGGNIVLYGIMIQ